VDGQAGSRDGGPMRLFDGDQHGVPARLQA